MNFRELIKLLDEEGELVKVSKEVDPYLELAAVHSQLGEKPALYENVKESRYKVVAGICSSRKYFAKALGVGISEITKTLAEALKNPTEPKLVEKAPCQEVVERDVNLNSIPIPTHFETDGGPYITSAIAVVKDPDYGRNVCFHRLMKTSENTFTIRVVKDRGTDTALKKALAKGKELEIAFCIGAPIQAMLAAATSPPMDVDEFSVANALGEMSLVKCVTKDIEVPASSEIVLEGRITSKTDVEGPFVDLTNTLDIEREQPVVEIDCITHRKDALYHALLPAGPEHKLLMGMPREPTIFNEVNKVCACKEVLITPGGCSWLHAAIKIKKNSPDDGKKAIQAAFKGHTSLKHCVVVDEDINIHDPDQIEWAIATRFQADKDLVMMKKQPSSSLDPSAEKPEGKKAITTKVGIDATIPWGADKKKFERVNYRKIDLNNYGL